MFTKHRFFCYLIHNCKAPDDLRQNFGAVKALATTGKKPDPSTYLSKEYIDAHMKKFEDGAAFIITADDYINYPTIGHADKYATTPNNLRKIIREAQGNVSKIKKALGLTRNIGEDLNDIYFIYIKPEQIKNPRIPDGNAKGTNKFWIPGGSTASEDAMGIPEIVIDCTELSTELFDQNYNNLLPLSNFK